MRKCVKKGLGTGAASRQVNDFAAGACGEGRHYFSRRICDKMNGAVAEQEIRPHWVQAPEMETVARVVDPPWAVMKRPPTTSARTPRVPIRSEEHTSEL